MPDTKQLLYFNALFDLSPGGHSNPALNRAAREMGTLLIPMGTRNDLILLFAHISNDYIQFLEEAGLDMPQVVNSHFKSDERTVALPWGWDEEVIRLFSSMGISMLHPDPAIVRKVNNREFCHTFSLKESAGVPNSLLLLLGQDLNILFATGNLKYPSIVKPAHGSSGFGFILLEGPPDNHTLAGIKKLLDQGSIILEPWCKRVHDISSSLTINFDGTLSDINHYRCHVNSRGTFYGVYLSPDPVTLKPWTDILTEKVHSCAGYLYSQGFFGPAGFDSFTYEDKSGNIHLAPIIEINARHVISDIARALKNRLAPQKHVFYRLLNSKRCHLPDSYPSLRSLLGETLFSPCTQEGILPLTPLRITTDITRQPYRNAFFIAAQNEKTLFELDAILLEKVQNKV